MATGGEAPSSSCEQTPDIVRNCSICEESGVTFEASRYCQDCDKCLCTFCLRIYHNKFLKNHTIIGREQRSGWIKPRRNLDQECVKHTGSPISMYCGRHDVVCCPVCAALEHGPECHGWMSYIPDMKDGLVSNQNYQRVLDNIDALITGYTELEKKAKRSTKVQDAKAKSICTMTDFRRKVLNVLADLELKSIIKMNEFTGGLDDVIASCVQVLNETKQELEDKKAADDIEKFITIKSRLKQIRQHESLLFERAQCSEREIQFIIDDKVQHALETLENAPLFGILQSTRSDTDGQSIASSENGDQKLGTTVKFQPPRIPEHALNIQKTFTIPRIQVITAMKEYETKSLEELRFEDYQANRKGQPITPFNQPSLTLQKQSLKCDSLPSAMIVDSVDKLGYKQASTFAKTKARSTRSSLFGIHSTTSLTEMASNNESVVNTSTVSPIEPKTLLNPSSVGVPSPVKKEEVGPAVSHTGLAPQPGQVPQPRQIPQPGLVPASAPSAAGTKPSLLPANSLAGQGQGTPGAAASMLSQLAAKHQESSSTGQASAATSVPTSTPQKTASMLSQLAAKHQESSSTGQTSAATSVPTSSPQKTASMLSQLAVKHQESSSTGQASAATSVPTSSPQKTASMLSQLAVKHQESSSTGQASAATSVPTSTPQKTTSMLSQLSVKHQESSSTGQASAATSVPTSTPQKTASMLSQLAAKHQESSSTGQASAATSVPTSTPQKIVFQGFTFTSTPKITETIAEKPKEEVKEVTTTADGPKSFSGFSFSTPTQSSAKTPTTQTQPAANPLFTDSTLGSLQTRIYPSRSLEIALSSKKDFSFEKLDSGNAISSILSMTESLTELTTKPGSVARDVLISNNPILSDESNAPGLIHNTGSAEIESRGFSDCSPSPQSALSAGLQIGSSGFQTSPIPAVCLPSSSDGHAVDSTPSISSTVSTQLAKYMGPIWVPCGHPYGSHVGSP